VTRLGHWLTKIRGALRTTIFILIESIDPQLTNSKVFPENDAKLGFTQSSFDFRMKLFKERDKKLPVDCSLSSERRKNKSFYAKHKKKTLVI
jgi:hypothetical protein